MNLGCWPQGPHTLSKTTTSKKILSYRFFLTVTSWMEERESFFHCRDNLGLVKLKMRVWSFVVLVKSVNESVYFRGGRVWSWGAQTSSCVLASVCSHSRWWTWAQGKLSLDFPLRWDKLVIKLFLNNSQSLVGHKESFPPSLKVWTKGYIRRRKKKGSSLDCFKMLSSSS